MSEKKKKSEIAIVLICLLGIAVCIYILNSTTFFNPRNQSTETALGTINQINSDVRLKINKQYFWQEMEQDQTLSEGDSIFTGPKSSSEVTLSDGKKILISENSLIRLTSTNHQISVDLAFGKLFSSGSTKPLVISDCGKTFIIEPSDATFELSKGKNCGSIDVKVTKGTIKMNKKSYGTQKIKSTTMKSVFTAREEVVAVVSEEQPVKFAEPKEKLSAPNFKNNLYKMTLSKKSPVELSWNSVPAAKKYLLEKSETSDFQKTETFTVDSTSYSYQPETDGNHYFRLKAADETGPNSDYGNPAIVAVTYPKIQLGQKKIIAEYKARTSNDLGTQKKFPITWTAIPDAEKYLVELDSNSQFTKPKPLISRRPASNIAVPQTGTYHYRVSAFNQQGRMISSSEGPGEIIYKKMFDLVIKP